MRPALALLALSVLLAAVVGLAARPAAAWPTPVFEDHIALSVGPADPTEEDAVTVSIHTRNASLFIKGAILYLQETTPDNVTRGPYPYPMASPDSLNWTYTIAARPNGTLVRVYVVAWDYDNAQLTSAWHEYRVRGPPSLGWQFPGFEENVEVSRFPPIPQPHDEVTVWIRSKVPSVGVRGATLYIRYIYQTEPPKVGGFAMAYVNGTHLAATIPGFPPGTEVVYWIVAWDRNVETRSSPFYSYNLSVDKYTRHENIEFPQVETVAGISVGLALLVPVAVYYADLRRRRRGVP